MPDDDPGNKSPTAEPEKSLTRAPRVEIVEESDEDDEDDDLDPGVKALGQVFKELIQQAGPLYIHAQEIQRQTEIVRAKAKEDERAAEQKLTETLVPAQLADARERRALELELAKLRAATEQQGSDNQLRLSVAGVIAIVIIMCVALYTGHVAEAGAAITTLGALFGSGALVRRVLKDKDKDDADKGDGSAATTEIGTAKK